MSTYLEGQIRKMDSVKLPSDMPSLEDTVESRPASLSSRIHNFCQEKKNKREQERQNHKVALKGMKENKEQQLLQ